MGAVEFRGFGLFHIARLAFRSPVVTLPRIAAPHEFPRDAHLRNHPSAALWALLAGIVLVAACGQRQAVEEPVGETYVGPVTLNLRKDLAGRSPAVAAAKHGDRLDVLEVRRRFVRVRTQDGVEGWTDSNLLLSSGEMTQLAGLAARAAKLPSQGAASVFDALNMHAEPKRQSPSFFQIPEGGVVEVVDHTIRPRIQTGARTPVVTPPRNVPVRKKAKTSKQAPLLLPPPRPPVPPARWELARPRVYDLSGYAAPASSTPTPMDDWSLVRTPEGKAGWVLSRALFMTVPDEVAQYAEGHRITAYVPLGEVRDGSDVKKNWLWTTAAPGVRASEFDSFRVFVWSTRRHRYETAYVERDVTGYFPVEVVSIPGQQEKGFALIVEETRRAGNTVGGAGKRKARGKKRGSKPDTDQSSGLANGEDDRNGIRDPGKLYRRVYAFAGYRVRLISKEPYEKPADTTVPARALPIAPTSAKTEGWWAGISAWSRRWWEQRRR